MSYGYATVRKVWNRWEETDDVEVMKVRLFKTESERDNGINLEWKKIWNDRNFMKRPSDVVKFETKDEYIKDKNIDYLDIFKVIELSELFNELVKYEIIKKIPEMDIKQQMTSWIHGNIHHDKNIFAFKKLLEQSKQSKK